MTDSKWHPERTRRVSTALVLLALGALASPATAQLDYWEGPAAMALEVRGDDGKPVEGATITLQVADRTPPQGPPPVTTDGRGRALISHLGELEWYVEVQHESFMLYAAYIKLKAGKKPVVGFSSQVNTADSWTPMRVKFAKAKADFSSRLTKAEQRAERQSAEVERQAAQPRPEARQPAPSVAAPAAAPVAEPATEGAVAEAPAPGIPAATAPATEAPRQPPPASAQAPATPDEDRAAEEMAAAAAVTQQLAAEEAAAEAAVAEELEAEQAAAERLAAEKAAAEAAATERLAADRAATEQAAAQAAEAERVAAERAAAEAATAKQAAADRQAADRAAEEALEAEKAAAELAAAEAAEAERVAADRAAVEALAAEKAAAERVAADEAAREALASQEAAAQKAAAEAAEVERLAAEQTAAQRATAAAAEAETPAAEATAPEPAAIEAVPTPPTPLPQQELGGPRPIPSYVTSADLGTCPGCQPGEWSMYDQETVASASDIVTEECPVDPEAIHEGVRLLVEAVDPGFAGPISAALTPSRYAPVGRDDRAAIRQKLGDYLTATSTCHLVGVLLPAGSTFGGYQYEAWGAAGGGACVAGTDCPVGRARWGAEPTFLEGPVTAVYALFHNRSTRHDRRARFTVYFVPPAPSWTP